MPYGVSAAAGKGVLELPIFGSKRLFPNVLEMVERQAFVPFRRRGQSVLYRWYYLADEVL